MLKTSAENRCGIVLLVLLQFALLDFGSCKAAVPADTSSVPDSEITLSLGEIIARVQQKNRYLLQTQLSVQSSQLNLQGVQSIFDWKIRPVANLGLSKSDDSTQKASGISGKISKKTRYGIETTLTPSIAYVNDENTSAGVGVSLSVPLLRGFGRDYNGDPVDAADFALKTSVRNVYLAEVETVVKVIRVSYEVIRQRTFVDLYSRQKKALQSHAATTRLLESTGLGTPTDTYRAEIRLKDVEDQLQVAKRRYLDSLDRLKIMIALPVAQTLWVEAPLTYTLTRIESDAAEQIAVANRLELEQAEAEAAEMARKSNIAKRRLLPDLNFVATYRKNTFLDGLASSELYYGDYWSVGFTSETDLARSEEQSRYQQSLLNVRRAKLQQQEKKETILAEVRKQLNELKKEEHRIRLRQEQIVQAKGKMRLAEIKFSHGMGNNFDYIESEAELQRAKVNLLEGKIAYIVGQYKLRAVMGTLITR